MAELKKLSTDVSDHALKVQIMFISDKFIPDYKQIELVLKQEGHFYLSLSFITESMF